MLTPQGPPPKPTCSAPQHCPALAVYSSQKVLFLFFSNATVIRVCQEENSVKAFGNPMPRCTLSADSGAPCLPCLPVHVPQICDKLSNSHLQNQGKPQHQAPPSPKTHPIRVWF